MNYTIEQLQVLTAVEAKKNVFVTGPGGTGKTTLIKKIQENSFNINYGITATTGSAAVLFNGTTLYSFLGIGLARESVNDIVKKMYPKFKQLWQRLELLVIDEISMCSAELFEKLNLIAQSLRGNTNPYGGIQLVLLGDFLQLPCIKGEFAFTSKTWADCNFTTFYFHTILRQSDLKFQECLNRARIGAITDADLEMLINAKNEDNQIKPTKIFCHNVNVDDLNSRELQKLQKPITTYNLKISGRHTIDPAKECNAVQRLDIAIGAQVMLLINLDLSTGLVNGSRGVVTAMSTNRLPIVSFKNQTRQIGFAEWEVVKNKISLGIIHQIPLRLAYAITVHKSQGLTLDCAFIDLKGVFEYGQAYVAVSRVKNLKSLKIVNVNKNSFKTHNKALDFYNCLKG